MVCSDQTHIEAAHTKRLYIENTESICLNKFIENPEAYAPQYGGYCAWAVSAKNDFAPADPKQWAIVDGKLYLNYDAEVKQWWDDDRARHIAAADKNWPTLIQQ